MIRGLASNEIRGLLVSTPRSCRQTYQRYGKRRSPAKQRQAKARVLGFFVGFARVLGYFAQEELLAQRLLLEERREEKVSLWTQELAEQELARSSLVEEGVEWRASEEEEED
jgi:hypothetical protein